MKRCMENGPWSDSILWQFSICLKSKWKAVWKENLAVAFGQRSILLGFYSSDSPLLFWHGIQIVSQEHLNGLHCLIPYL